MDKKISTLLREIKNATGWSESRLASKLDTSQPTVNRILNGQEDCKGSTYRAITALHHELIGDSAGIEGAENLGRRKDDQAVIRA
jgi:transcriptional regulator with XRE-family HTH domain